MNKHSLFLTLFLAAATTASAQQCKDDFLGTKTLYHAPGQPFSKTPAHYEPLFINYVGRHGARHLTKEVNTAYAYHLLANADSASALTPEGVRLKQMVERLYQVEHKKVKSISQEGRQELQEIGSRMAEQYPQVFARQPQLSVAVTKEIRTEQSAAAFLQGLKSHLKDSVNINQYNDDIHLRFYDASPAYVKFEKEGSWQPAMVQLAQEVHAADIYGRLAARIFKPAFAQKLTAAQTETLTGDIFGFATIVYSLDAEVKQAGFTLADLDFKTFFTCNELQALGKLDAADDYLKKGPGADVNGLQVRIAAPLLIDFIRSVDDYIKTGKPAANLRFAHAETIAPFAALLNISTADKVTGNLAQLSQAWQAGQVAPLSSNIQWIVYRDSKDNYLVKLLLNEHEARITGLKSIRYPYYEWNDLRAFYLNKLTRLNVKLEDDMKTYLTGVK